MKRPKGHSFARSKPASLGGELAMVHERRMVNVNPYAVTKVQLESK